MITIDLSNMEQSLLLVEEGIEALTPNLDPKLHYKAAFISEEILTNLARHAHFENKIPDVTFMLHTTEQEALLLTFKDNANAFDILKHPDPKMGGDIEDATLGGLGIYLTKQYAKHIQYCQENEFNILKIFL